MTKMQVIKRNGKSQDISFDKIFSRINYLVDNPIVLKNVNSAELTQLVIQGLINNIKTSEIDDHTANLAAGLATKHYEYLVLAGRVAVNNHHKNTLNSFADKIKKIYQHNDKTINYNFNKFVNIHKSRLDSVIDYDRDYLYGYFGFKTLENGYLIDIIENGEKIIIERPQDYIMRVAIQIHMPTTTTTNDYRNASLDKIIHAYNMMSQHYYTHATPTLFNSGSSNANLSSCFLLTSDDSLEGITDTITKVAKYSKWSGGVGVAIHNWRAEGSYIRGTNGHSDGVVPFLRIFNATARAFNQGGGKRKGSFAIYIEMHHPDIKKFLELKLNDKVDENMRCPDLFPALWVSDLFMKRLKNGEKWSTFCPDECPGLSDVFGDEYENLYLKYEAEGKARNVYDIMEIWSAVFKSQCDSGVPYILYKDAVNRGSMQHNVGTNKLSNLCVSGDTMILTSNGYYPIKELTEYSIPIHSVWNGEIFTPATFAKTNTNQELMQIVTTHGNIVKCTPYHKFILIDEKIIEAKDLQIGDELIDFKLPYKCESKPCNKIKSITINKLKEDTYCFNETIKHRGVFNGLLLGNCVEITIVSDSNNTGVCNLSSICLPKFVEDTYSEEEKSLPEENRRALDHEFPIYPKMNYKKLAEISSDITENLNNIIDVTYTPTIEAARSNFKHRPIGIGVQGLADVFLKFGIAFESEKARDINKKISEAIYYGAVSKSTEICRKIYGNIISTFSEEYKHTIYKLHTLKTYPELENENVINIFTKKEDIPKHIGAYPTYAINGGSHLYNGKFHWELYGLENKDLSGLFDWESVRSHIKIYGMRNCLTTAYMPTGTTSSIMGCSPSFEPYVANSFTRSTLAGNFAIINKYLIKYLQDANIYDNKFNKYLLKNNGSIQNIEGIPNNIKELYKTSWEIKQKTIMQLAADRQPFIDQSQSMNLWFADYNINKFTSAQFFAWNNKLKTGNYYIRTEAAVAPQKFTISVDDIKELTLLESFKEQKKINDDLKDKEEEICLMCSA
jgi:ribonucleotide reductase alpha subunit